MEQAPAPGFFEQILSTTGYGFGIALWIAAGLFAALWIFNALVRLGNTFDNNGALAIALPPVKTATLYAIAAFFALGALAYLSSKFIGNTVWDWLPSYSGQLLKGLWVTIQMLVLSLVIGFALAIPVGLVQVTGPAPLAWLAKGYCTVIRGTPLLMQLWLLYYGLGSLFQSYPEIRQSFLWPVLREGYFYGVLALTLSVIGYEGEIMRGAFLSVPKGEIEAARAFGMSPFTLLRRVWLPRAIRTVLPTLGGEVISQLKDTPVVSTVTIYDLFGVSTKIRQETYNVYEPLLFVAVIYFLLVWLLTKLIAYVEAQVPQKR